jgi:hypothetical protein
VSLIAELLHEVTLELDRPQDAEKLAVVSEALAGVLESHASELQKHMGDAQTQVRALVAAAA